MKKIILGLFLIMTTFCYSAKASDAYSISKLKSIFGSQSVSEYQNQIVVSIDTVSIVLQDGIEKPFLNRFISNMDSIYKKNEFSKFSVEENLHCYYNSSKNLFSFIDCSEDVLLIATGDNSDKISFVVKKINEAVK